MRPPVFVFGISGATWQVIDPLLAAGRLPALSRLLGQGSRADLLSTRVAGDKHYRPQVAWASLATGCEPSRHGVTKFYHSAQDLRVPSLWEIFTRHGWRVGVYGWPLDWPPVPVNGFIVPSHLARDSRTWPADLESIKALDRDQQNAERAGRTGSPSKYLALARALHRNGVRSLTLARLAAMLARAKSLADAEARSLLLRRAKLDLSAEMFTALLRRFRPEFCSFHTFFVDFVSHRFWRYHEPDRFGDNDQSAASQFRNAVTDAYIHADRVLGRLLAALPGKAFVAVMSEHGMRAEPGSAELGRWRYVIDAARLSGFIGLADQLVGSPVARWIAYRARPGQQLPADAAIRLRRVVVAETGLPLFQVHEHGADEIVVKFSLPRTVERYRRGDLQSLSLRLGDRTAAFISIAHQLGSARSAMHDLRGMLVLSGPGLRQGERLPDVRLVDVAPTLLHMAGLPVPISMDGHVLDIFASEPRAAKAIA